jgi:tetratricopeptide (TPR) repeat protein
VPGPLQKDFLALRELREKLLALPEATGVRHLMRALALDREQASAGHPLRQEQLRGRAIEQYRAALGAYDYRRLEPPILLLNNLGWHLAESGDAASAAEAVAVAGRARERCPDPSRSPDVHDTFGWALFRAGRLPEAEQVLRALASAVESPSHRYRLARVLLALERFDEALEEVRRARESSRRFPEADAARELEEEIKEARRRKLGG